MLKRAMFAVPACEVFVIMLHEAGISEPAVTLDTVNKLWSYVSHKSILIVPAGILLALIVTETWSPEKPVALETAAFNAKA